ncbi:hypothetical protein FDP41_006291 [Naegleria fowleri]|uniref:DNA mismatch repair proteins mutS family domain-containing protein n=1 Tax=Naegleria fowleri TaxID=5763 RepID=A0A6A5BCL5_NAEFO|nr:uncharacterized protein FDP41_006291 [Naegleria fowleri]KAF0974817.1 hypothetical protein FDP41_006291 [Naegleria fowleri]
MSSKTLSLFSSDLYSSDEDEDLINTSNNHNSSLLSQPSEKPEQEPSSHLTQSNVQDPEQEDNNVLETSVVLSLCYQKGRLGVASFDSNTGELWCGETNENSLFEATEYVKYEVKPNLILVPSRTENSFIKNVKKPIEGAKEQVEVRLLKASDFAHDNSTKKLQLLEQVMMNDLPDRAETAIGEEPQRKNSIFDFSSLHLEENHQTVRALGGLLSFLQSNRLSYGEIDDVEVLKNIKTITNFKFDGFVQLDMNTLKALSIFSLEVHPSTAILSGRPKEGLSLFGIMNKTKSSVGKDLLRQWFLKPVMDVNIIQKRHDAIDFFNKFTMDVLDEIRENLKYVKNTKRILARMREAKATVNDWSNLYKTLYCCKNISEILFEMAENSKVDVIEEFLSSCNQPVVKVLQAISKIVDFKESRTQNRLVIMSGVNSELDNRRQTYESLDTFLDLVAQQESGSLPQDFPFSFKAVYYPQLGFLLVVDKTPEANNFENFEDHGLRFHFASDRSLYFKNATMDELDSEVGDIHHLIIEQETSIAVKLEKYVLQFQDQINKLNDVCAKLDCILSLTVCSTDFNLSRPRMVQEPILKIIEGRNILQELTVDTIIPNDTNLSECIQIVTGPNNSGKSCYLKQVGLIVFMAHIGSFTPASQDSVIGITDRIMTRIQSQDSISVNQSTFAIDLLQMKGMIDYSTPRSLLLIDEFGKGTLALDGIALLSSILKSFQSRKQPPRVIATTHYVEMLQYNLIDYKNKNIQFMTMDVHIDKSNNNEDQMLDEFEVPNAEDLVFLYKLKPGKIIPSYGITVASLAGLPDHIIHRAKIVADNISKGKQIKPIRENSKGKLFKELYEKFMALDVNQEQSISELFTFVKSI